MTRILADAEMMGWLDATPYQEDRGKKSFWPHNRRAQWRKEGREIPPLTFDGCRHLAHALAEIGPFKFEGMGAKLPIEHADVWFYHKNTEKLPHPVEREIVVQMSRAYLRGYTEGANPLSIPPTEREAGGDGLGETWNPG